MNIPMKYEDVVAQLEAERELHKIATETLGQFADENQKLHAHVAALREELAERKRKHLRSCQLAIGKSQLAKELQQRLTVAEQRESELEGLLEEGFAAIPSQQGYDGLLGRMLAALKPAAEAERCFHCNQPGGQCCTTADAVGQARDV